MEYFGGVPERWIIDNLKAGVDKPDREEPRLNPSFREFAKHYNIAVLPARSGQPTDKAKVEAAVGAIQTLILLALRHETFFSLEAMNAAIRRRARPAQRGADGVRREPPRHLRGGRAGRISSPCPRTPGSGASGSIARSGRTAMCGSRGTTTRCPRATRAAALTRGSASAWSRCSSKKAASGSPSIAAGTGATSTPPEPEHMPDRLKAVQDIRKPDYGDILLGRARKIGPNAVAWAERCFASRDFSEQAFATVQGMIRLADDHGAERLDALCAEALDLNRLASGFLRERIKNGGGGPHRPRAQAPETIPDHGNIRGGNYYGNDEGATP